MQTLNQGSKTCLEFLNETKSCASFLAVAGQPIEDDDLISYVLGGLNSSYTIFITLFNFTTCTSSMTFEEFQCELLNHEILLNNHLPQQQPLTESGNFALYNQKPRPSNNNYHKGKAVSYSKNSYQPRNAYQPNHSRGYPRNNYQSNLRRPGGNHFSSQSKSVLGALPTSFLHRPSCQICGEPGHLALDCYHRMDYSYQRKNPPSQFATMVARAHPSAMEQNDEEPWYADSGANNHVTAALDNLTLQEPFKGDDEVAVGNGTGLSISNIGASILYNSKNPFQQPFKLNHILHCPTAAANLLSIQKFCVDNKCWFILIDSHFFVKDNITE